MATDQWISSWGRTRLSGNPGLGSATFWDRRCHRHGNAPNKLSRDLVSREIPMLNLVSSKPGRVQAITALQSTGSALSRNRGAAGNGTGGKHIVLCLLAK